MFYRKFHLILLIGLALSAATIAQDKKVTIYAKEINLKDAMVLLQEQSETRFMYSEEIMPANKTVSINARNTPITKVLGDILAGTDLYYKISASGLILIAPRSILTQRIAIAGRVTDESGTPLPGAGVKVKDTPFGTVTKTNGTFELFANADGLLVITSVGMVAQTVEVHGKSKINVSLKADEVGNRLNEVIVVGYGTQRKIDITGSLASLNLRDLDKTPALSADQLLQGRISGLQFTQSDGQPGSSASIRIRGTNSINSGNDPLYVVDGFAGVADLSAINPNDIQSIEVLKDASSTAIYGSRASNGVVLVTTKKGKANQHAVNLNAYSGLQSLSKRLEMMNASQFAKYLNDYTTQYNAINPLSSRPLPYSDAQVASLGAGTDWQKELYRTAAIQNYQLSLNGGTNEARYYLSLNHFDQDGIIENTGFRRELLRLNLDRSIGKKITMGFSSQLSYSAQAVDGTRTGVGYGAAGGALNMSPIVPLRNAEGSYSFQNEPIPYVSVLGNPVAGVVLSENNIKVSRALVNTFGEYEIIKGLKLKSSIGIDYGVALEDRYLPSTIYVGQATGGAAFSGTTTSYSWLNENTLSYTKNINNVHAITALAGFSLQEFKTRGYNVGVQNFFTDVLGIDNLSVGSNILTPTSNTYKNTLASIFTRINYGYDNKYLFTFTVRTDGSSRFGANSKWGYFPSGAIAWRVSEERFLKNVKQLSDLKVRASYGITGNQEIGSYQALSQYTINGYSLGTTPSRVVGTSSQNIANPKLGWESTASFDVGFDLGLFNNRLNITADYYEKTTRDLLLKVSIPQSSGFSTLILNSGKVANKGIELAVNSKNIIGKSFSWSSTLTYAANRNMVVDMNGTNNVFVGSTGAHIVTNGLAPSILKVGYPIGSFYGYRFGGIWQSTAQIAAAGRTGVVPGDAIIMDLDGNGVINSDDREVIGQANPKFNYGLNNTFSYRNLELSIFIQGVQGNKVLNVTRYSHNGGTTNNQYLEMINAWNGPGTSNTLPRAFSTTERGAGVVDRYLEDGSYLRIQTVSLAYKFAVAATAKLFKQATVYATAQNLYTFTNYTGYNPEINSFARQTINTGAPTNPGSQNLNIGSDINAYPPSRILLVGLKLGF